MNSNSFMRVQVRVQKKYFFEFKFKFEFGETIEFFRVQVRSPVLDISCENIFALFIVTALTACLFSINGCAKMSAFYVKTAKIRWRLKLRPTL